MRTTFATMSSLVVAIDMTSVNPLNSFFSFYAHRSPNYCGNHTVAGVGFVLCKGVIKEGKGRPLSESYCNTKHDVNDFGETTPTIFFANPPARSS